MQLPNRHNASYPPPSLEDPAFEPQAGFDFDDANDEVYRNMQNSLASLNGFHSADHGFTLMTDASGNGAHGIGLFAGAGGPFPVGTNAFTPTQGMSSHIDPSSVWSQSTGSPVPADPFSGQANGACLSGPVQSAIVQKRNTSVAEQFGQITPPEDSPQVKTSTPSEAGQAAPTTKMDKSQRARNAANQRHAKSKKAREARKDSKDTKEDEEFEGSGDDVEDKREKYREKNRLAAAKCRMKKKENVETLEERHRRLQAQNSFFKREERELRDELTVWRTMALQHNQQIPGCDCQPLHLYNSRKASEVAHGWGGVPMASSPSDSMASTAPSPGTFDAGSRHHSLSSGPPSQQMSKMSRQQSFAAPSNYAFAPVTTPDSMQVTTTAGDPGQFSNFLRNSAVGGMEFS
ncbi:hypothetical protein LTR85_004294 [Meristemomyces frigidus]|nr:hypothetical protein LTR85_004294 [Meristemomyces frigidus]